MNIYFGENLKKLRQERSLTQERLAEFLGVSFQTISKWERGDNYPDIMMLPEIASFFKVSVDGLLGVNRAEDEKEISETLYAYDNHKDEEEKRKLIFGLKEKFPHDYRVLLRYMMYHVFYCDKYECDTVVRSIYENINNNCTDDSVRICAKRYIVQHYRNLSEDKNSGVTFEDVEKILSTTPNMRDGKDFISVYLYRRDNDDSNLGSRHYEKCKEAIEEMLGMLDCVMEWSTEWTGEGHLDYNIELIQTMNKIFDMFYGKNYGMQWRFVMKNQVHLGYLYTLKKDFDNAVTSYRKAAELAKEFDALDDVTILDSKFLKGKKLIKKELGTTFVACSSVAEWIKRRENDYPKELIERDDYKGIFELLK